MSIINKLSGGIAKRTGSIKAPVFRFGGFEAMGAHTKAPDTRTTEQLLTNIDYFAERNPEVADFKKELKSMNPKHLGLVSDICELANRVEMLNTGINIKKPAENGGKSLFAFLMEKLPKASKENPEALDFAQEVINQTDSIASKYYLASSTGLFDHPEAAEHLKAAKPLVKEIARAALSGGYTMDYSKERSFVETLSRFINKKAHIEKIKILPEVIKTADSVEGTVYIDSVPFIYKDTPMMQIRENLARFPQEAKKAIAKGQSEFNITDFLTQNVNFAKAKQNFSTKGIKLAE